MTYNIGELKAKSKVEDFKNKALLAAFSAETKGGTYREKLDRFKEIFKENVNVVVAKESEAGVYFTSSYGCRLKETRNVSTYWAWIY